MKIEFKRDAFKDIRGSYSRMLKLSCSLCDATVLYYQKDGPGSLMRTYMDRIFWPKELADLQHQDLEKIDLLKCPGCGEVLGTPYIYELEDRKAIRLYHDAVTTQILSIHSVEENTGG